MNLMVGCAPALQAGLRIWKPSPPACKRSSLLSVLPSPCRTALGQWRDRSTGSSSSSALCTLAGVLPYGVAVSCILTRLLTLSTKAADEPDFWDHHIHHILQHSVLQQ